MTQSNFNDILAQYQQDRNKAKSESKDNSNLRITVLGGGSFGTAMANTAVRNGCDTMIWIRDEAVAAEINATHINQRYLPDFTLEKGLVAESNLEKAVRDLAVVALNRMGTEGESSRSAAGESYNFDNAPKQVYDVMNRYRLARVGGKAHEAKTE